MKIAVEGCAHGELNKIYESVAYIEARENIKVDLLICCGDFQSVRDQKDMHSMAVPQKFMDMKDFHEYYSGKRKAPVLTLFIGGNHEAALFLWELPYGGWVAENIYYMGYAGVVSFAGYRIGGLSGIYKSGDYYKGHFEKPPFNESTKRSFYHVRSFDVAKIKLLADEENPIHIFLSHDWPKGIYNHGNCEQLLRFKPYFKQEIDNNELGSDAADDILKALKPAYWFSGHMHAKFSALVEHENGSVTRFLALDKCLPKRNFLQILDIGPAKDETILKYDASWLAILRATDNIQTTSCKNTFLCELDEKYKPTVEKTKEIKLDDLKVIDFSHSSNGVNVQTFTFCERFNLVNPCNISVEPICNNAYGSSRKSFGSLSLPKPIFNFRDEIEDKSIADKLLDSKKVIDHSDEFAELKRPIPRDLLDESFSDESSSGEAEEDNLINPCELKKSQILTLNETPKQNKTADSVNHSFSSFIETPFDEDVLSSSAYTESKSLPREELDCTPVAKKKFLLVRRNQEMYTPKE
ncbi:uncharacterized protein LOC100215288 isoform X1 [Hydra vulgaris]|uniref:uncharacterized protein LOC100215288 isoform X1 n=1 Tax=Hydra vulgaris TaxID=6087 RepID=UPI0001925469|nr:lariat debranching enzyme-like isoform X1 [Hydra vulgaris]